MKIRRLASTMAALVLLGGTLAAGAGSASANQVWYQSVGKASAEAPCPTSTGPELTAGWTQWSSSWAMWANQGRGGFVCNREITWAYSETLLTPSGPGCVRLRASGVGLDFYLQFGSSNVIPYGAESVFLTADCSGVAVAAPGKFVFVLSGSEAIVLCGDSLTPFQEDPGWNPNVYGCEPV